MATPTHDSSLRIEGHDHLRVEVRRQVGAPVRFTLRASNIAHHVYDQDPARLAAALEAAAQRIREGLT